MMQGLDRRLRKLESVLPPLLTPSESWIAGLLWFAVAYYLGNPSPGEKPFAAYARALGYADESELKSAMGAKDRELALIIANRLGIPTGDDDKTAHARAPRYAKSERNRGVGENHRDLPMEVYRAENKVLAKFDMLTVIERDLSLLEDRDKAIFWEGLKRMYAGLPRSYKKQLNRMVLVEMTDLAWMRMYYRDDIGPFLRCFA
jgi:hypothetical protein